MFLMGLNMSFSNTKDSPKMMERLVKDMGKKMMLEIREKGMIGMEKLRNGQSSKNGLNKPRFALMNWMQKLTWP